MCERRRPRAFSTVAQRMANGVDNFHAGDPVLRLLGLSLMGHRRPGPAAHRLRAALFVGRLPGGLGYVNTLTCMLFGSISGSAPPGGLLDRRLHDPRDEQEGVRPRVQRGRDATAATTEPPDSASNAADRLLRGRRLRLHCRHVHGRQPRGILVGLCIMATSGNSVCPPRIWESRESTPRRSPRPPAGGLLACSASLLLVILIIGGILLERVPTATKPPPYQWLMPSCSPVVVFRREIPWKDLPEICLQTGDLLPFSLVDAGRAQVKIFGGANKILV